MVFPIEHRAHPGATFPLNPMCLVHSRFSTDRLGEACAPQRCGSDEKMALLKIEW